VVATGAASGMELENCPRNETLIATLARRLLHLSILLLIYCHFIATSTVLIIPQLLLFLLFIGAPVMLNESDIVMPPLTIVFINDV